MTPTKPPRVGPETAASSSSSSNKRDSDFPIRYLKGVGPKIAELFEAKGIRNPEDLLNFFPYKYLDRRKLDTIGGLTPGPDKTAAGRILAAGLAFVGRGRRRLFEIVLGDDSGTISLKWFRFIPRQMLGTFKKGMGLLVSGPVTEFRGTPQFIHPTVQIVDPDLVDEIQAPGIVPVYSQIPGLGQKVLRRILRQALDSLREQIVDPLPPSILARRGLPAKAACLEQIHFPPPESDVGSLNDARTPEHRRAVYEELFFMELGLAFKRKTVQREEGVVCPTPASIGDWKSRLPFRLTTAQERVLSEILGDIASPYPMNRLLQGDVGCGKTVVALLAALVAIENGYQAALMAPTEILADQHFVTARSLLARHGVPIALLKSSLAAPEKKKVIARVRTGDIPLLIGTHALVQEGVRFKNLGLGIVDEQHRFGVLQRAGLKEKGRSPNLLVMTATPIPRTLAMTLYGDLDLSVIDELPPGREPVETQVIGGKERRMLYNTIGEFLNKGGQGYIVYPLIEESEKLPLKDATRMAEELRKIFPGLSIALLHGRLPQEEKDDTMRRFKEGEVQLLVSTTVIEVGIDVPNASLMVVENAERFGLSQLHQLRGRVGRGRKPALCLLVTGSSRNDAAWARLEVMRDHHDGFRIAEEDLAIRGPGDFLGTRQSGLPELRIANILRDHAILKDAREDAFALVEADPPLATHPTLKDELMRNWKERLALADVG